MLCFPSQQGVPCTGFVVSFAENDSCSSFRIKGLIIKVCMKPPTGGRGLPVTQK